MNIQLLGRVVWLKLCPDRTRLHAGALGAIVNPIPDVCSFQARLHGDEAALPSASAVSSKLLTTGIAHVCPISP